MKLITTRRNAETISGGNIVCRGQAGFTLVEVLIAVVVISAVMIAFFGALSSGFTICAQSRENLRATQILTRKIEDIRLCNWGQLTNNIRFVESYDPAGGGKGVVYYGLVSTNAASGIPAAASYKDNMRLVTVTVSWTNSVRNRPLYHQKQMQTLVARYGLQNYVYGN